MIKEPHGLSLIRLVPLLGVALAVACGAGPGAFDRFQGGETITVEAQADIEIALLDPVRLASVRPLPESVTAPRGGVALLSASAVDSRGRLLTSVRFEWRMRQPLAGTITGNGVFTAGNVPGTYSAAIETLAIQEVQGREFTTIATTPVVVTSGLTDGAVTSVIVFPSVVTAEPGELVPLRAAVFGNRGGFVQDVALFWQVLDSDLGEIDTNGLLTVGTKPGFYEDAVEIQARRLGGTGAPVVARASVRVLSSQEAGKAVRAIIGPSVVVAQPLTRVPLVLLTFDFQGRPVPTDSVVWEVVEPEVGVVGTGGSLELGSVPGLYPASVRATARLGGAYEGRSVQAYLDIVVQSPLDAIRGGAPGEGQIIPSIVRVVSGQQAAVSLIYTDTDGNFVTAGTSEFEFDPAVVQVDVRGRVTAVGPPGTYVDAIRAAIPGTDGAQVAAGTVVIVGPVVRAEIRPARGLVAPEGVIQFSAFAFDAADNHLYDIIFRWELADGTPGTISNGGLYEADDRIGVYSSAVRVRASQRQPR